MELFANIVNNFPLLTEIIEIVVWKFNIEIYKKMIVDMQINFSYFIFKKQ